MADDLPLPQPTSVLQAVNILLDVIKVGPVSSLELADTNTDALMAIQAIHNASIAFQMEGWVWNTEEDYPIAPETGTGYIKLPANTLKVDTTGRSYDADLVPRGNRLYDRKNHTFRIDKTVYVNLVIGLPFEDLTQSARSYVTIVAARTFAQGRAGDGVTSAYTEAMEFRARALVEADNDQQDDRTLFEVNPHLQRRAWYRRRA